jgi:diguanylate cyclase (GGDEF)-like protein
VGSADGRDVRRESFIPANLPVVLYATALVVLYLVQSDALWEPVLLQPLLNAVVFGAPLTVAVLATIAFLRSGRRVLIALALGVYVFGLGSLGGPVLVAFVDINAGVSMHNTMSAIAGALLQVVRRRSLKILTDVDRLENQLGSTDVLTGALTRQGLITLGPTVRRAAQRVDRPVFAMIVDVEDLGGANRTYGTGYGDDLLRTVAEAMRTAARDADLLGRWSGDEFALIGMGGEDSIAALAERIPRIIAESPVTLGKTPLRVKMGTAVGTSAEHVEDIVERALADLTGAGAPDETDEAA